VLSRLEQSENFTLLSLVQAQSQKTSNTKLVDNFLNFPFITHTLEYNRQKRSYDRWKSGGAAGNQFWIDQTVWTILDFNATFKGNLEEL
jgi:hypothetical protein